MNKMHNRRHTREQERRRREEGYRQARLLRAQPLEPLAAQPLEPLAAQPLEPLAAQPLQPLAAEAPDWAKALSTFGPGVFFVLFLCVCAVSFGVWNIFEDSKLAKNEKAMKTEATTTQNWIIIAVATLLGLSVWTAYSRARSYS